MSSQGSIFREAVSFATPPFSLLTGGRANRQGKPGQLVEVDTGHLEELDLAPRPAEEDPGGRWKEKREGGGKGGGGKGGAGEGLEKGGRLHHSSVQRFRPFLTLGINGTQRK